MNTNCQGCLYWTGKCKLPKGLDCPERKEQAEKDLSLTIEDIELLHTFLYAVKNNKQGVFTFTRLSDEQYKEALRRFKAIKEGVK